MTLKAKGKGVANLSKTYNLKRILQYSIKLLQTYCRINLQSGIKAFIKFLRMQLRMYLRSIRVSTTVCLQKNREQLLSVDIIWYKLDGTSDELWNRKKVWPVILKSNHLDEKKKTKANWLVMRTKKKCYSWKDGTDKNHQSPWLAQSCWSNVPPLWLLWNNNVKQAKQ